jgi:hypothetical protein
LLVKPTPRNVNLGNGRFAMFNKERDISYGGGHFLLTTREAQSNWLQAIFCSASARSQQGNF